MSRLLQSQPTIYLGIQQLVKALNHDLIFAAHPGQKRIVVCIRYYWPGMKRDVELFVTECVRWQKGNGLTTQNRRKKLALEVETLRLENQKSSIKAAYKTERENTPQAYATNKHYCDARAVTCLAQSSKLALACIFCSHAQGRRETPHLSQNLTTILWIL
jgi:hypothetical protein